MDTPEHIKRAKALKETDRLRMNRVRRITGILANEEDANVFPLMLWCRNWDELFDVSQALTPYKVPFLEEVEGEVEEYVTPLLDGQFAAWRKNEHQGMRALSFHASRQEAWNHLIQTRPRGWVNASDYDRLAFEEMVDSERIDQTK